MKTIIYSLLISLFLGAAAYADAEKARASIERIIRADGQVSINAWLKTHYPDPSKQERIDPAALELRQQRFARDWPVFIRAFTTESPASTDVNAPAGRILKSNAFWLEFFRGASSDDVMRTADSWTTKLLAAVRTARAVVELDADATRRGNMLMRIDMAERDLIAWQASDFGSSGARRKLGGSLPALIAPL